MAKGTVAKNNAIKAEKTNQVKAAEPKTNEKASDVLQAAKNAAQDVKTAVKNENKRCKKQSGHCGIGVRAGHVPFKLPVPVTVGCTVI